MVTAELIHVVPTADGLGESIIWHPVQQAAYWTDMPGNTLRRYFPAHQRLENFATPENLCSLAFIEDSDQLLCAFQSGLAHFQPERNEFDWLFRLPNADRVRLNDGRMDRQGRFWVGSLIDTPDNRCDDPEHQGKLYCYDRGDLTEHMGDICISNGIGWSPDNRTMYFADSPRYELYAMDFDAEKGEISNRRVMARTEAGIHPDGSTVDTDGYVWNAQWGNGKVVRYTPDGQVDFEIHLPVKQVTCVTFGGPDLSQLFVTTANWGLDSAAQEQQPHAGHLFIYQTNVQGFQETFYPA